MSSRFVSLERRFVDLDPRGSEHPEDQSAVPYLPRHEGYSWQELLELRCVVVLAEAGSGKTREFEDQAQRQAPHPAFLVTVTDLAAEGISALRRVPGFDAWLDASAERARFFLDSVDTALLERQTLKRALSKLRWALGSKWEACHVLLSCRGSDWRPDTDLRTLEEYFPPRGGSAEVDGSSTLERAYRVVRMLPLTLAQAGTLAEDRLGAPSGAFLAAVADAQADFFLTRPLDVTMLADIWRERRQIPALHALLPLVIDQKLRETNDERPPRDVAPALLRESARALAAAQLFCRASHVRVSTAQPMPALNSDLDPGQVLPHLPPETVAELLTRALFDVATYGRARFHHRSVQEYLAAEWLLHLLEKGCGLDDALDLLFRDVYGVRVAIPSRVPVLAWLAIRHEGVRDEAIRHAPDALLRWADPSALPIEWRRRALHRFVRKPTSRFDRWEDEAALRRFSHSDLAPDISALLSSALAPRATITLLEMVRVGRLSGCAQVALQHALDSTAPVDVRIAAAQAVAASGQVAEVDALVTLAVDTPELDPSLLASVCQDLFPQQMTVTRLLNILRRACPQPAKEAAGLAWYVARRIGEASSADQAVEVLAGVLAITRERGLDAAWLLRCAFDIGTNVLTRAPHLVPDELFAALMDLSSDEQHHIRQSGEFREAITKRADVRQRLFWHVARSTRAQHERPTWFTLRYECSKVLHLSVEDMAWLQEDASVRADPFERLIALDAAMVATRIGWDGEVDGARARIASVAANEPDLQYHFDEEVVRRTTVVEDRWQAERGRRDAARERDRAKQRQDNAAFIHAHLDALRSGEASNILTHLDYLMREAGSHDRWGVADFEAMANAYGTEVAEAAVAGFSIWWKRFTPPLPHEREERNSVGGEVPCGLSGLLFLSRQPGALGALSPEEATLAARYACTEINGFPTWFAELADAHPESVLVVLRDALASEFVLVTPDGAGRHDVLAHFRDAPRALRVHLAPFLIELLRERPGHPAFLGQALAALADLPEVASELELRARGAIGSDDSPDSVVAWWPTWFALSPADAFAFLETWAQITPTPPAPAVQHLRAPDTAEIAGLEPESALLAALSAMNSVDHEIELLSRILRLLLARVPHTGDVEHRGTYTPSLRDHAQRVRERTMEHLAAQPGAAAHRALVDLASVSDGAVGEWLLHKARLRAQLDSEPDPWSGQDVARFRETYRRVPRTDDELFQVALARLRDIRRDLEGGDFSVKAAYWEKPERDLQIWLAGELNLRNGGCYSVERESVVVDENRTDIRLRCGPQTRVTLELKRAQACSVNDLLGALETQLVGQYMREQQSRHGVLVLCMNGNADKWWEAPGGARWRLEDVVAHLGEYARTIVASNKSVTDLRVLSFDFRRR